MWGAETVIKDAKKIINRRLDEASIDHKGLRGAYYVWLVHNLNVLEAFEIKNDLEFRDNIIDSQELITPEDIRNYEHSLPYPFVSSLKGAFTDKIDL